MVRPLTNENLDGEEEDMYQLYKKQVEAWKEKWRECGFENDMDYRASILLSSRHKDTIELIEAVMEMVKKVSAEQRKLIRTLHSESHAFIGLDGYLTGIDDVLHTLQAELEIIKKES